MTEQRMLPVELLRFLNGEADLDGVWFGDRHPLHKGVFWWRKRLKEILDGPGVEPFAYYVYFPDAQDGEFCTELDDLIDRLTNERHEVTPLFDPSAPVQAAHCDAKT